MPYLTLTLNGYPVDLPPDAQVALSYRANDLRNLDSREAAFSETFTLPLTAQNVAVLGSPHSLDSLTTTPYRLLPAVLRSPGGAVLLDGFGILELSHEGYDVTLTSALGGLFAQVGNRSLRELDLRAFDHELGYANVLAADANQAGQGYTYALCDTGPLLDRPASVGATFDEVPAATFVLDLLRAMLADPLPPVPLPAGYVAPANPLAGYRLTGSLLAEDLFQDLVLPRATAYPQLRAAYVQQYTAKGYYDKDRTYTQGGFIMQFAADLTGPLFAGELYTPPAHAIGLRFQARIPCSLSGSGSFIALFQQEGTAAPVAIHTESLQFNSGRHLLALDVTLPIVAASEQTRFYLRIDTGGSLTIFAGASFAITPSARAWPGAPVHLDAGLPASSQADLLKLVCNQFNVLLQVDTVFKTIRFDLFNDLEKNRGRAVDWTAKLDFTKRPRLAYVLGDYAQRNLLAYAAPPSQYTDALPLLPAPYDQESRGSGTLLCRNATRAAQAEAYASDLLLPLPRATGALVDSAGQLTGGHGADLLWLPFFELADPTKVVSAWDSEHAYSNGDLVLYLGQSFRCTVKDHDTTTAPPNWGDNRYFKGDQPWQAESDYYATANAELGSVAVLAPYAGQVGVSAEGLRKGQYVPGRQLSREDLGFDELLSAYYPGLAAILDRVQVLTLDVRLNALDVADLDFAVPVRVKVDHVPGYGKLDGLLYLNLADQFMPAQPGSVPCTFLVLGNPVPGLAPKVPNPPLTKLRVLAAETGALLLTEDGFYFLAEA